MNVTVRQAEPNEYEKVRGFYYRLIDDMQSSEYHPKWQKGVYPDDEYLRTSVEAGEMYLAETDGEIAGAMIVNRSSNDGYDGVKWPTEAKMGEVSVIHALGVLPKYSRRGIAKQMVRAAADIARDHRSRVIRLDVLVGNLPADRLYRGLGFAFVERVSMYYEDTGWCDFDLFEYGL